jgi:two-component system KDP operon response regulator KdpE
MMPDKPHILIVEDEPKVVNLVREVLLAAGYLVSAVFNGQHAIEQIAIEQPDLVLLDIRLSGALDGFVVAQRVREFSDVPIIMLTARVKESDVLQGFEAGADDYITKPFSTRELLVRIQAVLKRARGGAAAAQVDSEIICDSLRIDLARRQVTLDGQEVHLTPTEYKLLHELAIHPNQVLVHEHLLGAVWGPEYRSDVDYLRAYIHTLRQKIELDSDHPKIIQRCPGVGYVLVCTENSKVK